MADTRVASGLTVEQWDDKFFTEYLTENRYNGEMGTDEASIIQVKENLTKKKGDRINFALVNKLSQDAITGRQNLEGNEEDMSSRSCEITVDKRRNGVRVAEIDEQYSAIGLREAGRAVLKDWSLKDTETLITKALGRMTDGTSVINMNATEVGASANQTALDAWLTNNGDRVYFGNNAYTTNTDLSAGLATLTNATAAENLTPENLSAMKFIAETRANPLIRPVRVEGSSGRRYYVVYAHPLAFRDLKKNSTITQAQREVELEMENYGEELDPANPHPELIKRFARACGISDAQLEAGRGLPTTEAWLKFELNTCRDQHWIAAMAATHVASEAQEPVLISKILPALRNVYKFSEPELEFWWLHAEVDVDHGGQALNMLAKHCTTRELQDMAIHWAYEGARNKWLFWDGINLPNLRDHIVRDRDAARFVVRKAGDHRVTAVEERG